MAIFSSKFLLRISIFFDRIFIAVKNISTLESLVKRAPKV